MKSSANVAAALAATAVLTGCFGDDETRRGNASRGGSITIAESAAPDSLDPVLAADPASQEALWLVYTPPYTYRRAEGADGTRIVPALADALPRISSDGRIYRFRFRDGLRYSDGSRLRASDFERSLERVRRSHSPGAARFRQVIGVSSDDRTRRVQIVLSAPEGEFLDALASTFAAPVSRRTRPAGIGPYVIAGRRGGGFLLRRNRRFRLPVIPPGNLDLIVARVVPDASRRARGVIGERYDLMQDPPPPELLPGLRSEYRNRFEEHTTLSTIAFVLDSRQPPFDDLRVRRAAGIALDSERLQRLLAGRIAPGCNLLPPLARSYRRVDPCPFGAPGQPRDLERASKLIDDAGARRARLRIVTGRSTLRIARYFARSLAKVGLRPRVSTARVGRANASLLRIRPGTPHPAAFIDPIIRDPRFRDPELETVLARVERKAHSPSSADEWARLDRELIERAEVIPVGSERQSTFLSGRLDFENCSRFHPVFGNDFSSFCLR